MTLAESRSPWAIPWPCLHEFLAIVTHPRIYNPPTPLPTALDQVEAWLESPSLVLLGEDEGYWEGFRKTLEAGKVSGPMVHDARIAPSVYSMGFENYGQPTGTSAVSPCSQ